MHTFPQSRAVEQKSFWFHGKIIPEQLMDAELRQNNEMGKKAWFVFHGIKYIEAFNNELDRC